MNPIAVVIGALVGAFTGYLVGYLLFDEMLPEFYSSLKEDSSPQAQKVIERQEENVYQAHDITKQGERTASFIKFIFAIVGAIVGGARGGEGTKLKF